MRFIDFNLVQDYMRGKRIAVVGSGPSVLDNKPGFIDSYDIVVRVNNYKLGKAQGARADVHHSFYGGSIRKTAAQLKQDGVKLCMCKCPNDKPISSPWHEKSGKQIGIDFRPIYRRRHDFWFCDTFVPPTRHFMMKFGLLGGHIPTSGFTAIHDVLMCEPALVYITGFDFFSSGLHNVDEKWRPGNPEDPIGHQPELEKAWLKAALPNHPITTDNRLRELLK